MTRLDEAARFARTVRHLRLRQIAWRIRRKVRRAFGRHTVVPPASGGPPAIDAGAAARLAELTRLWAEHAPPAADRLDALRGGQIGFLNSSTDASTGMPWSEAFRPRLWRYHLHYFDWARDFARAAAIQPNPDDAGRVQGWMADWIEKNPPGTDVAWDPFVVAVRLMNWATAAAVFGYRDEPFLRSAAAQARWLLANLEHDIAANHLFKDAAALVVAGSLFGNTPEAGLKLLEGQCCEQILADGGHFERSPMYHAHVLEDALTAYAAFETKPGWLRETIERMTTFLAGILHPDGEIPFFNDAALEDAAAPRALIAVACALCGFAAPPSKNAFPDSGFFVLGPAAGGARMILKAGPPGPDYQPGHAHCDMLSFELSAGGDRFIVNSGVHDYEPGDWREYCRSTRAHNTVQAAGREQLECWAVFRVGRRYRVVRPSWIERPEAAQIRAAHDGFAPYIHERTARYDRDLTCWIVHDCVTGPGPVAATSYLHLHPETVLAETEDVFDVRRGNVKLSIVPFGASGHCIVRGQAAPRQGWYCPRFGAAEPSSVIELTAQAAERVSFGFAIVPEGSGAPRAEIAAAFARLARGGGGPHG